MSGMIDTHCHLYLCKDNLSTIVDRSLAVGVTRLINIAIDSHTSQTVIDQAKEYPDIIYPTVGIHPCEASVDTNYERIQQLASSHPVVAIGEIGLDYYHMKATKAEQLRCFEAQLSIAETLQLPVVIHNRKADEDIRDVMKHVPKIKKVLHCFSSSLTFAESVMNEQTFFSFTGNLTYAKKGKMVNAVRHIPLEKLMIETDCPYLTPISKKGQPNEPSFVPEIGKKIAAIKALPEQAVQQQCVKNAVTFFNLPSGLDV